MSIEEERRVQPTEEDNDFLKALQNVLEKYQKLDPANLMAITAQFVGQISVFQDRNRFPTQEHLDKTIMANVEEGRNAVMELDLHLLLNPKGSA